VAFPASPQIFFAKEASLAGKAERIPPPQAMRLELEGLKLLERTKDFEARIEKAIVASKVEGEGSINHLRYRSLKLKYLEEIQAFDRLLGELQDMITNTHIEDPKNRAYFQSSARSYEARVRLRMGDKEGAKKALENALALIADIPESQERKEEIQRELSAL
jgi:hypothetical protein